MTRHILDFKDFNYKSEIFPFFNIDNVLELQYFRYIVFNNTYYLIKFHLFPFTFFLMWLLENFTLHTWIVLHFY